MWKEQLPVNCPLKSSNIVDDLVVYRLIKEKAPVADDFDCHWNINPTKRTGYLSSSQLHCSSLGVSVHDSISAATAAMDLPRLRGRFKHIAELKLQNTVGVVSNFDVVSGHGTLWLYANVDLMQNVIKVI